MNDRILQRIARSIALVLGLIAVVALCRWLAEWLAQLSFTPYDRTEVLIASALFTIAVLGLIFGVRRALHW